jgi:hypothetical protein
MTLEMVLSQQVVDLKHRIETLDYLLNLKLPVDVIFNGGTNKAGTTVGTLALRIQAFNEAQEHIKNLDVDAVRCELAKFNRAGGSE